MSSGDAVSSSEAVREAVWSALPGVMREDWPVLLLLALALTIAIEFVRHPR